MKYAVMTVIEYPATIGDVKPKNPFTIPADGKGEPVLFDTFAEASVGLHTLFMGEDAQTTSSPLYNVVIPEGLARSILGRTSDDAVKGFDAEKLRNRYAAIQEVCGAYRGATCANYIVAATEELTDPAHLRPSLLAARLIDAARCMLDVLEDDDPLESPYADEYLELRSATNNIVRYYTDDFNPDDGEDLEDVR